MLTGQPYKALAAAESGGATMCGETEAERVDRTQGCVQMTLKTERTHQFMSRLVLGLA